MSVGKVLIGVMAGVAAGATLGVLYAPDKGSTTRKRFSRKGYNYTDELEEKFNELIDSITLQFETVVEEVNRMAENGTLKTDKNHKTASAESPSKYAGQ
ncbi:MAG: YtxH domain-containing protein [Bacteroidota bacterium]